MLGGLQFRSLHRELVESGKMTDRAFHDAVLRENANPDRDDPGLAEEGQAAEGLSGELAVRGGRAGAVNQSADIRTRPGPARVRKNSLFGAASGNRAR